MSIRRSACRSAVTSSRRDIRPGAYFARGRPLLRSGARAAGRERAARGAPAAVVARRSRRSAARPRARVGAATGDRGRPPAVDDPLRPAGDGEDDDRADRRRADRCRVRGDLGGLGPCRRRARRDRPGARPARRERPQDDPLHRRDPSLQQGAAGLGAARRRGRPGHADRRDHGEPVLRGERRAALALHRDRADRALGRGARRDPRARSGDARGRGLTRGAATPRRARGRRRAGGRSRCSSSRRRPRRPRARR